MNWLAWRYRLEYLVFRTLVCVIQMLSPARARDCAEGMGVVFHRLLPRKLTRYAVSRDNLRQALGPEASDATIDDYIRRMWVHLFRVVIEIIQLPRKARDNSILDVVQYGPGRQAGWSAFNSGRPVIMESLQTTTS